MVLATIATSLALYLGMGSDSDPEMLDVMGSGDAAENDEDEKVAAQAEIEVAPKIGAPPIPPPVMKKSKKVADDWDASEDAIGAEEDFMKSRAVKDKVTDQEEYDKLMNVYKAFRELKKQFDEKFRAIWA